MGMNVCVCAEVVCGYECMCVCAWVVSGCECVCVCLGGVWV